MKKHSKRYIEKVTPLSNWLRWYRFGMGVDSGGVDPFIIADTAKTLDFNQYISSNGLVDNYAVLRDCILINKPQKNVTTNESPRTNTPPTPHNVPTKASSTSPSAEVNPMRWICNPPQLIIRIYNPD